MSTSRFMKARTRPTHVTDAYEVAARAHWYVRSVGSLSAAIERHVKKTRTEVVRGTVGSEGVQELAAGSIEEPVALHRRHALVLRGKCVRVASAEGRASSWVRRVELERRVEICEGRPREQVLGEVAGKFIVGAV